MALDPSISLQVAKPFDPMEAYGKALQLKSMLMQSDMQQKAMKDAEAEANAWREFWNDPAALEGALARAGLGNKVLAYRKASAEARKAGLDVEKTGLEIHDKRLGITKSQRELASKEVDDTIRLAGSTPDAEWGGFMANLAPALQQMNIDPALFSDPKVGRDRIVKLGMTIKDQLAQAEEANKRTGWHLGQDQRVWSTDSQGKAYPVVDARTGQQIKGATPAAIQLNNANNPPGGPAAPGQFGSDALRPWRENQMFKDLSAKDGVLASDVDAALNHDYKFGGYRSIAYDRRVQHEAQKINPYWRQGGYDLKQKLLGDPEVNASNAAVKHLADFKRDFAELDQATQSQILNRPINKWFELAQGDSRKAEVLATLETTAKSIAEEYGKALHASNAMEAGKEREALFNPNRTGGQLNAVTRAVATLIQRVVNSKENTIQRTDPNAQPLTLIDPQAAEAMKFLGIEYTPGGRKREAKAAGFQSKNGWELKPAAGSPDLKSKGTNTRFPKAYWTPDGPDGAGWYERHGNQIGRVE